MHIKRMALGPIETNCFILWSHNGQALVVDPGSEAERIAAFLDEHELSVLAYLVTHGHADHVSALAEMHRRRPAPVAMHPGEAAWAFEPINRFAPFDTPERPAAIERELADGQTWEDGPWTYDIIETPGHSPTAVAFHFPREQILFSGDTLFRGSVGRTDLPGGDPALLNESLQKLAAFPGETVVYPGHGPATTIGEEKRTNYFLLNGV